MKEKVFRIVTVGCAVICCAAGITYAVYWCSVMYWYNETGPNNQALIVCGLAYLGGIVLGAQIPFLIVHLIARKWISYRERFVTTILIIAGMTVPAAAIFLWLIKVAKST